jgi:hypothetical protein
MPLRIDTIKKYGQVFILSAIMGFVITTSTGLAAEPGRTSGEIRTITPMRERSIHRSNLNAQDYFDVVGVLNQIDGNRVTIGDRELTIAPGVRTSRANQYNLVGANLNKAGEIVVFELVSDDPN